MDEKQHRPCFRRHSAAICMGLIFALSTILGSAQALGSNEVAQSGKTQVQELVPVGRAVGVKLFAEGVLVVKLSEEEQTASPAKNSGLKTGDIILMMNDIKIESTEQVQSLLEENGEKEAQLTIKRGSKTMTLPITPQKGQDGVYRIGAWIRDSMAGIGTVTFYDPATKTFAALGHGITDVDTGALMPLSHGAIMPAAVKAVKRGESGAPGELRGDFDMMCDLGTLYANTDCGIFGILSENTPTEALGEAIPIAKKSEIAVGKATILANCSGEEVREYEIEIEKVYSGATPTRNMLLRVTDPELLAATGGIVQGMSGSPILQNGCIVGAVTHVLVDDPTRGYGISIENMLDAAG